MQEEEYMEQQPPIAYPLPRKQDSDKTVRWKIDAEDVIKEIVHYLKGDKWDDYTQKWLPNKDIRRRLCNELGVGILETHLIGVLN